MAKQILDLYMLYKLVTEKGGLVEIINKKIWREITKGLNLPTSITSAAFTLRTQWVAAAEKETEHILKCLGLSWGKEERTQIPETVRILWGESLRPEKMSSPWLLYVNILLFCVI